MASRREISDRLVYDRDGGIARLREIMRRLRAPDGCPWDREQSYASIAPYTIEEACEVADAIARQAWAELPDELGDLLLQVMYHSQIAAERGDFDFDDVVRAISDKMLRRHPHVFGTEPGGPRADPQSVDWEEIKARERTSGHAKTDAKAPASVLDNVPVTLSAMTRALKLTRRAARVGFDWADAGQVLAKMDEERAELSHEIDAQNPDGIEEEYGDLLFVLVNLGRKLGLDPESALRQANAKFERRFRGIEASLARQGRDPSDSDLEEMETLWAAQKVQERDGA